MKIVLVNPPLENKKRLYKELAEVKITYPPLGLCYLASTLRKAGYQVEIVDLQIYQESLAKSAQRILSKKPDFVGLTAATVAIANAAKLAKEIRLKNKTVPIIIGGAHFTAVPQRTLIKFPVFDLGVVGEGERTILELLKTLREKRKKELETIPGIVFREGRRIISTPKRQPLPNLDELPLPAFDLLPDLDHYGGSQFIDFEKRKTFRLVSSRGCPFNCSFCDRSVFGRDYRTHSPKYVMEMVKTLYHQYGIRHIYFSDDTFTVNKPRVKKICSLLLKQGLDLTWDCNSRVDTVDYSLLKAMRKAGCTSIAYGIETGSAKILKILNKGITLEQIRKTCQETAKVGIKIRGNFMIACPGDTQETISQTIKFAKSLPLFTFKMSFFTPFPGTELYYQINQYGEYKEDWEKLSKYSPVFVPKEMTLKQVEKSYKKAYFSFYFRPKIVLSYLFSIKTLDQLFLALSKLATLSKFLFAKKLKRLRPVITLVITGLIFFLIFKKINIQETVQALGQVKTSLLGLSIILSLSSNLLGISDKWRRIIKALGHDLPYKGALEARIGSYPVRGILPLKSGETLRIAYIKKYYQIPLKAGAASSLLSMALNVMVLIGFIIIGFLTGVSL